jgi:hypothetical protein
MGRPEPSVEHGVAQVLCASRDHPSGCGSTSLAPFLHLISRYAREASHRCDRRFWLLQSMCIGIITSMCRQNRNKSFAG